MKKEIKLSLIIPVFNEEKHIKKLLDQLIFLNPYEIIVVDGGSTDATHSILKEIKGLIFTTSSKGRANQMNHGASLASGDILFFLHADSYLQHESLNHISDALLNEKVVAGSFYLEFDKTNFWLNLYSKCSKLNISIFTYGDQGLFIRKEIFDKIGGFKSLPLMEDLEIQRRIRRVGLFKKLDAPVITSARRYVENGFIVQQLKNIVLVALYLAGVPVVRLAKYYK